MVGGLGFLGEIFDVVLGAGEGLRFGVDVVDSEAVHDVRDLTAHERVAPDAGSLDQTRLPALSVVTAAAVEADANERSSVNHVSTRFDGGPS